MVRPSDASPLLQQRRPRRLFSKISSDFSEIPGIFWYINIDQVEL